MKQFIEFSTKNIILYELCNFCILCGTFTTKRFSSIQIYIINILCINGTSFNIQLINMKSI
jgi:hypothetical protein